MGKKQKIITVSSILIGMIFAGFNFYIFSAMKFPDVNSLANIFKDNESQVSQTANVRSLITDIAPGKQYKDSQIRKAEIDKIKENLPYFDEGMGYSILYSDKTTDITVELTGAKNLAEYREKKLHAEYKMQEFGSTNPCLLLAFYAPPPELKKELQTSDGFTSGCKY